MATKGVLIFRGDLGNPRTHYAKSQIADVIDDTALGVFATGMAAHTECNIAKRSMVTLTIGTDSEPGVDANVDRKAVLYFRDPTTLKVHSITIPAPVDLDVEDTQNGERVTDVAGAAIVALINTATGKSYTWLYGVVIQKR